MRTQVMLGAGVLVLVSLLMAGCGQSVADGVGGKSGGAKVGTTSPCCGGSHEVVCPDAKKCACVECKCCEGCKTGGECQCGDACGCCDTCPGKKVAKKCACAECKCCDTCKTGGECKCEACECCDTCPGKKAA